MWFLACDHCKEPIQQVGYQVRAVSAQDPEHIVSKGPVLHWQCIAAYLRGSEHVEEGPQRGQG